MRWIAGAVVWGTAVLLATMVISNFIRARNTSRRNACYGNLRLIDSAKEQWTMANDKEDGALCTMNDLVISGDNKNGYIKQTPICQTGGTYTVNNIGQPPSCSIHGTIK